MFKKIFCLIFCVIIVTSSCAVAFAYEPTGFDLHADTALFACLDTGEVLYQKNEDKKVYPASITKIMTVVLMLESPKFSADGKVQMSKTALDLVLGTGSSVSYLKEGEEISQLDLVYFVLMASYGDCAYLAAEIYGESIENFVDMMNKKAKALGMKGTHYSTPVGLHDEQNYTTANDTLILTQYALKNEIFKTVCESARYTVPATNMSHARTLSTTNFLQDTSTNYYYTYAKGVKTGYTDEAGRCLVSTASCNGYNYICILFGCPANAGVRYEFLDSKNLYRWAFNNFEYKTIAKNDNPVTEMPVELSLETDFIPLYLEKNFVSVLPVNADDSTVTVIPHLKSKKVDAPIKKGQVLGTADIVYAEKVIGTVNLVAGENIKQSKMLKVIRAIKNFFLSKYMIMFYCALVIVIIIFVIWVIKLNSNRQHKRKVRYISYDEEKENSRYGKH